MIRKVELNFKQEDFARAHEVPFANASAMIFGGLRILLDEQTPSKRRFAAVVRIREYAGLEPSYTPFTEILKQRVIEQMAKPGVVYPARVEIETEMGRNSNYVDGIAALIAEVQSRRMARAICQTKNAARRLRRLDPRHRPAQSANRFPLASGRIRARPRRVRNRHYAQPDGRNGSSGLHRNSGRDETHRRADRKQRNLPSSDYRDVITN